MMQIEKILDELDKILKETTNRSIKDSVYEITQLLDYEGDEE